MNRWMIPVGADSTTAVHEPAEGEDSGFVLVQAHGAGSNMDHRTTLNLSATFRAEGIGIVRFNFLYSEKKSGPPDRMPKLMETFSAVVSRVRHELPGKRLLIGGHSMGGRAASMMGAEGFECDGLILLAYPLHPAGRPEKLRDAHLASITVRVICFNGTRDELCTRELMEKALKSVGDNWTMHWIEGADHGFHVQKKSGRTDAEVLEEIGESTELWLRSITDHKP